MQDSNAPVKIPAVWAYGASPPYITAGGIPVPSQQGAVNGAASFQDGFPPNCWVPYATGGAGPFGRDFNAIMQQATAGLQWLQAGGPFQYDTAFSTAISGYPKFAKVPSANSPDAVWLSTVDNNTSNPDTGGANWVPLHGIAIFGSTQSWDIPASRLYVRVWGGGGGGGGCSGNNFATGGGGAGYCEGLIAGLVVGSSVAITIGIGGAGGTAGGGNGGIGSSSSFGSYMTATGGTGGAGNGDAFGVQGTASGGALNFIGNNGSYALRAAGGIISGGQGGSAFGSPGLPTGVNGQGGLGVFPGVGGNGAGSNNGNSYNGGYGGPGLIIVTW